MLYYILDHLVSIVSIIWIACITIWVFRSLWAFIISETKEDKINVHDEIRSFLGSYILLWLDFIIVADIFESVVHRGRESLAELWIIVIVRIAIAYFLTKEIKEIEEKHKSLENVQKIKRAKKAK